MSLPSEHPFQRPQGVLPPALAAAYWRIPTARFQKGSNAERPLSWTGISLFFVTLLICFSAFQAYRIPIGNLSVHVYLVPIAGLALYALLYRISEFPRGVFAALFLFVLLFCFSTLAAPGAADESMKICASAVTIVVAALMVRGEKDFRLCAVGLLFAVTLLAILALVWKHESYEGANPLDVANENAFSLYTLPPLLLVSSLLFERKGKKYWLFALPCILIVTVATFSSANRSGWLGIALILTMQLCRPKTIRIVPWVALLIGLSYWAVGTFGDRALIKTRYDETFTGRTADNLRIKLLMGAINIGLENPVLGVAPQNVWIALGEEINYKTAIDAHNVFGYVIAGCGFIIFAVFISVGVLLWRRPPSERKGANFLLIFSGSPHFRLLRMMLVLWFVRGMFSREILYAPSFCIGLGLAIGLCISQGMWKQNEPGRAARPLVRTP
jgi:hypothetical protein